VYNKNLHSVQNFAQSDHDQLLTFHYIYPYKIIEKNYAVTGCEGREGCEMPRLPQLLDSWLTDGDEVVSLRHWQPFYPQEDSWYSFLLEAESTPGP
jgi:hypothetical protein